MGLTASILLWLAYGVSLYFVIFWFITFLEKRNFFKREESQRMRITKFPLVSVLIPAYNEENNIVQTIKSVLNLNYPKEKLEVIVINDGSTDKTKEKATQVIFENKDRNIKLINQRNQGKAAALNNALKTAAGVFFACLDADSCVDKETLRKMVYLYQKKNDSNLAIVTPAMKVKKPKNLLQIFQSIEYLITIFMARLLSQLDCLYVAPGPFSLYRTRIIKKLRGFDENSLVEDQEIAYRVQKHHYGIKQCYDAYVYTISPSTLKALYKQRNRWYKGSIFNIIKYRKIVWNREYGDFGRIQLSNNILIFILGAVTISFFSYYVILPILKFLYRMFLLNLDLVMFIRNLTFTYGLLDINIKAVIILGFVFSLALIILYVSYKNARERITKINVPSIILFFLIYYIILSTIEMAVLIELAIGRKQKW